MVVPAIVLTILSGRVVAVSHLHPVIIVVMMMLVDGDGIADVADLVSIPGCRRRSHAERRHNKGEQVPEKSKGRRHGS